MINESFQQVTVSPLRKPRQGEVLSAAELIVCSEAQAELFGVFVHFRSGRIERLFRFSNKELADRVSLAMMKAAEFYEPAGVLKLQWTVEDMEEVAQQIELASIQYSHPDIHSAVIKKQMELPGRFTLYDRGRFVDGLLELSKNYCKSFGVCSDTIGAILDLHCRYIPAAA